MNPRSAFGRTDMINIGSTVKMTTAGRMVAICEGQRRRNSERRTKMAKTRYCSAAYESPRLRKVSAVSRAMMRWMNRRVKP